MVDPVSGSGPVQNILSGSKTQANEKKPAEAVAAPAPVQSDTVEISAEAQEVLSVAQAEQAARDVRSEIQKELDVVLGIDPSFAEQVGEGDEA